MASAEREILNLIYTYADRLDGGDVDGVAELFEHAVITAEGGREIRGRDDVKRMYNPTGTSRTPLPEESRRPTKHVTTNVILDIDEGQGRARSRAMYTVLTE